MQAFTACCQIKNHRKGDNAHANINTLTKDDGSPHKKINQCLTNINQCLTNIYFMVLTYI